MSEQKDLTRLKVAIVHDWLVGGGAEKVVLELHRMFPDAPIYTSCTTKEWRQKLDNKVVTGWLQYFIRFRKFLPYFRYRWFRSLEFNNYDLVISSSGNGEARCIITAHNTVHVSYCHAVNQFYWTDYDRFMKKPGQRPYWLMRLGLKILVGTMKRKDYDSAQKVNLFLANSTAVQKDIQKYYQRESSVVFPPVETDSSIKSGKRQGFVTMARLVQWKRIDLIVRACDELDVPLTVIGEGPEKAHLMSMASNKITFTGGIYDQDRLQIIASKEAFIMANIEPFGIAPVEAMSVGTPIIALKAGGALDYVIPGETGEFFEKQSVEALKDALQAFDSSKYNSDDIKNVSDKFSTENFHRSLHESISKVIQ